MSDPTTIKEQISSSLHTRSSTHNLPDEDYVSHIKIWEDNVVVNGQPPTDEGSMKPRWILLTISVNGQGYIHKSKQNNNGTFSVGKTWKLESLQGVEVNGPKSFSITLARTYRWQTEKEREQLAFLESLVKLFYRVTGNRSLSVVGLDTSRSYIGQELGARNTRTPSPTPPPMAASVSAQSFNSTNSTPPPRRGVLRPPSISSMATSIVSGRSRAGSTAGSLLRDQDPPEPQMPTPVPRLPRQPRGAPQSYASNDSGPRSRPVTPAAPGSNTDSYPPARGTPQRSATRTPLGRERDSERSSQTERERISQAELRTPQPQPRIIIPEPVQDAVPSPRLRTPAQASPRTQRQNNGLRPPSPSPPPPTSSTSPKRDPHARISYFDPVNQAVSERLLEEGAIPDTNESTLASVEDMLEGFEWQLRTGSASGGAADQIEARLKDELMALEKANIHSFVESDDRLALVLKFIDDALGELNDMDSMIQSYKVHLNAVGDDISYIQGQNRGLQVQNQNQRALLNEIEQLLQTVHVDREALLILTQESLEGQRGIQKLEEAAAELYRALLAGRDRDMAATIERLAEYKTHNQQFCTRLLEFLTIMFGYQSDGLIEAAEKSRQSRTQPTIASHKPMEDYLGKYCGLMLYLREMDEGRYSKVCALYFSTASELHGKEVRGLFMKYLELVQRAPEEEEENTFAQQPQGTISRASGTVRRAGTMVGRSPIEKKKGPKPVDGEMPGFEAFDRVMTQVLNQIHAEETFISDFLHTSDSSLTFADYMNLDSYFKRQAARALGLSDATIKLVRGAMDLIFGFLPLEVKSWVEGVSKRDSLQLVGIIAVLQRRIQEAQAQNQIFADRLLMKSLQRLNVQHQRQIDEQLHAIEQTKLTTKKRKGVAHFIRYFPTYVGRIEAQLINTQGLEIRRTVDTSYERIVSAMFDALQQMAKMDGADGKDKDPDDKGVLNYHVIMIENMHHFVADMTQLGLGAVRSYVSRAEEIYDRELSAYVMFVLRRPMAKIIDYFDGVERLLQTTAPSEVHNNSSFNRSALKKVRVEKHFADADEMSNTTAAQGAAGPVLIGVWKACEEELVRLTDKWVKLIAQCYAESGVNLEYTTGDVRAAFRRHRG
ncbi:Exocyst complex component Sec3 [Ceratobasidium sp. AG-Ba]|nr:Exocyst complex component Sec3 [Ceratobasidium sp. AG-Ba]QRW12256.1 Exocyst complex component Sec3 [Ceratobasidium sp. AG-Ba]